MRDSLQDVSKRGPQGVSLEPLTHRDDRSGKHGPPTWYVIPEEPAQRCRMERRHAPAHGSTCGGSAKRMEDCGSSEEGCQCQEVTASLCLQYDDAQMRGQAVRTWCATLVVLPNLNPQIWHTLGRGFVGLPRHSVVERSSLCVRGLTTPARATLLALWRFLWRPTLGDHDPFTTDLHVIHCLLPQKTRSFCPVQSGKKGDTFSINACHPCAGTMLIFSVSFQF